MHRVAAPLTVVVTIFIAFSLSVIPLPRWADALWPSWVALVVFYWAIALPERFGVAIAWIIGLFMDALVGTPLGTHALALTLVAFVAARTYLKLRMAPVWQQSLTVGLALLLYAFVLFWIGGLTGEMLRPLARFLPVAVSAALWPWTFALLRALRRRFVVG